MGLSAAKQLIMIEERERHGCARLNDMGVNMLGPLVIRNGTDEQKQFFLPKILTGEHIWCQGYSEPNAGSDLAALRTEAVMDGEEWVVNGHKIWTSLAMDANWIFCLVRTDKAAKKQDGISFLLIPMDTPGITIRPIRNLDMHDEFCETFFDDVRVPKSNIVGQVNKGWTMAKNLLGFERIGIGSPRQSGNALSRLKLLAERMGVWDDATFQDRYGRLRMDLADHKVLYETFAEKVRRGEPLGPGRLDAENLPDGTVPAHHRDDAGGCRGVFRQFRPAGRQPGIEPNRPVHPVPSVHDLWRIQRNPAQRAGQERAAAPWLTRRVYGR